MIVLDLPMLADFFKPIILTVGAIVFIENMRGAEIRIEGWQFWDDLDTIQELQARKRKVIAEIEEIKKQKQKKI